MKNKFNLYLLSGDNEAERENLLPVFGENAVLLFNQSPTDKMAFINKLKQEGKKMKNKINAPVVVGIIGEQWGDITRSFGPNMTS